MEYALEKRNDEVHLYVYGKHGRKMSGYHFTWEQAKELHRQMAQLLYDHKFNGKGGEE